MVKYLDGDFGPEHFSKDFGFTDSAYDSRADHNRRSRQKNGVSDNDAAVGEGDGTYVNRSRGGRLHRAVGGSAMAAPQPTMMPSNRPSSAPAGPGNEMLGGATITMPAVNMARAADRMVQMGRGQGAREAMATQGARMPPGATQSLVANPPVHTPGIPGLKKGGRAHLANGGPSTKQAVLRSYMKSEGAYPGFDPSGDKRMVHPIPEGATRDTAAMSDGEGRTETYRQGGRAHMPHAPLAGEHPKGVLLIIAGHPGAPMKPAPRGRLHRADGGSTDDNDGQPTVPMPAPPMGLKKGGRIRRAGGGSTGDWTPASREAWERESNEFRKSHPEAYSDDYQPTNSMDESPKSVKRARGGRLDQPTTDDYGHSMQDWVNGHLLPSRRPQMGVDPDMATAAPKRGEMRFVPEENLNQAPPEGVMPGDYAKGGRLTAKARHALPASDFALPGGRYPIENESHGRNALARAAQHASPAEQTRIRAAVHRKYPDIGKR